MGGCCFSTISWNHEEGPSEDPRSLAQHPGVLLTGSLQDFLAPPDSSAKPPGGQARERCKGAWRGAVASPGCRAGWRGARADPRFGCLLWGPGSLGGGEGVTWARAAQRAAERGSSGGPRPEEPGMGRWGGGLPPTRTPSGEWRWWPGWGTRAA